MLQFIDFLIIFFYFSIIFKKLFSPGLILSPFLFLFILHFYLPNISIFLCDSIFEDSSLAISPNRSRRRIFGDTDQFADCLNVKSDMYDKCLIFHKFIFHIKFNIHIVNLIVKLITITLITYVIVNVFKY